MTTAAEVLDAHWRHVIHPVLADLALRAQFEIEMWEMFGDDWEANLIDPGEAYLKVFKGVPPVEIMQTHWIGAD